ncbi:hypothetical protein BDP27DRAFT_1422713 [Rhodocollybia butyracea]|uniref:Uncharacterized protein n=1 Tax=Rhodocollybia butyracea TaxID=206335 RepID=A0A9P5PT97_9AGAR|nr:hypothetical protein BDP27DRAFT_1422713 [Rhodocollybia butyracea]
MVRRIKNAFEHGDGPHGYIFHEPQIHVHVRCEVNDIPLLGFEPDWDNLVIQFDWKQTFSAFFREDKEFHCRVEAQKADILEMRVKIDRGELDEMAMFSRMLDSFGGSYDKAHKEVCFDQICKNIWDSSGIKWTRELHGSDDDSDLAYKALKEARVIAGFEKYSDEEDEGGDDDEEASQDDDEGDWSDTSEEE